MLIKTMSIKPENKTLYKMPIIELEKIVFNAGNCKNAAQNIGVDVKSLYRILYKKRHPRTKREKVENRRLIKCLGCQSDFLSEGKHNRLCVKCRKKCFDIDSSENLDLGIFTNTNYLFDDRWDYVNEKVSVWKNNV